MNKSDAAILRNAVFRLRDAFRNAAENAQDVMKFDITVRENQTMEMVYRLTAEKTEGIPLKELASSMKLSPATTSEIVDKLVKKGLLQRVNNPNDRRAVLITLSELGQTMLDHFLKVVEDLCGTILADLSPAEQKALLDGLSKMTAKL